MSKAVSLHVSLCPGLSFQFEALPDGLSSKVSDYLWYFTGQPIVEAVPPIVIDALPPPENSVPSLTSVLFSEPPLTVRSAGTVTLFELPEMVGWCDPRVPRGGITCGAPSGRDFDNFTHLALVPMLTELAIGREWLGLHAAALAVAGKGILLPGPSGSGKSTISRLTETMGCEMLSDDVVWLRKGRDGFRIRPFPRGVDRDRMKERRVEEVVLRAIVCPRIVNDLDGCRLAPVPCMQIVSLLLNQGGFLTGGVPYRERFRAIVELGGSVPGYLLEAGRDRMAGPRSLFQLVGELG